MFCYELPEWLNVVPDQIPDLAAQVDYVIQLSARNVAEETGGPFGAAVFTHYGRLIGVGVNRVMPENCSLLHAEVVAIMSAQKALNTWDLSGGLRLVTSCQPCTMCYGAIYWCGVSEMVYAATAEDARAIGFDEGPLPPDWRFQYAERGIQVVGPVYREEAAAVLQLYGKQGIIYNPQGEDDME